MGDDPGKRARPDDKVPCLLFSLDFSCVPKGKDCGI